MSSDILIVGGGVIGLTTAYRLAQRNVSVTVVDTQHVGREASWAGAGMLPPGYQVDSADPETRLRSYSHQFWKDLSDELRQVTGIDNGYRCCGALEVFETPATLQAQASNWAAEGLVVQHLDSTTIRQFLPQLSERFTEALYLPQFGQARNPRHVKALTIACRQLGVQIVEQCGSVQLLANGSGHCRVQVAGVDLPAERICVCAGAWTQSLISSLGVRLPVKPVRGQIVQLQVESCLLPYVVEQGRRYLVPRADGLVLIGSTEEYAGFEKQTTAAGVSSLLDFACDLVPALADAQVLRQWAGLRPGSPDELPFLGRLPELKNLFVGAGHFRSGLQMSPGTSVILADLLTDQTPEISLTGLEADRLPGGQDCESVVPRAGAGRPSV